MIGNKFFSFFCFQHFFSFHRKFCFLYSTKFSFLHYRYLSLKELGTLGVCNRKLHDVVQTIRLLLKNESTKKYENPSFLFTFTLKEFHIQWDAAEKQTIATNASVDYFNKGKFQRAIKQLGLLFLLLLLLFVFVWFFLFVFEKNSERRSDGWKCKECCWIFTWRKKIEKINKKSSWKIHSWTVNNFNSWMNEIMINYFFLIFFLK